MNKTLKALYDSFYTPLAIPGLEAEVKTAHRKLIERLDKQKRRLVLRMVLRMVLRIIDAQDAIANNRSLDSFICGFKLAWRMTHELNDYENERPEADLGARSPYQDEDE